MRKTITLLDLFSGIGGFHLGLERAGFKVKSYNSEIDKYANQVYKHNFKNSTYVGSVTDVRGSELPRINAITFGSPCQDFSIAGNRKGMGGERSSLILEAIRLIKECRPDFFIWENVKGTFSSNNRQDFAAILQAFANIGGYRLEWQLLNTKWFLPQNRERVYLVGHLGGKSRGQVFPIGKISQSFNKLQGQQAITCSITARQQDATANGSYINERKQFSQVKTNNSKGFEKITEGDSLNYERPNSKTRGGRVGKGIANTLDSYCKQAVIAAQRGRENGQTLEIQKEDNSNTITSVQKDNYVIGDYRIDEGYRQREYGESPCLTSSKNSENALSSMPPIINKIRRLTPIECERLQGFPDNWTQQGVNGPISDTQRYKMCGNAVTVDVVEAVAKQILKL